VTVFLKGQKNDFRAISLLINFASLMSDAGQSFPRIATIGCDAKPCSR
jgi:hypothetical protein